MTEFSGHDRERLVQILAALEDMAAGELDRRAPVSRDHDDIDAIAYTVNVVVGELRLTADRLAEAEAESRRANELNSSLLHEIGKSVLGTTDLSVLANLFVAAALRTGQYDIGSLRLARRDGTFDVMASHGFRDPHNLPTAGHPPRLHPRAMQGKNPLIVEDVLADPHLPLMKAEGIRSLVVVPILAGEEPLGTLLVGARSSRSFAPPLVKMLQAIGAQAGIALQRARLS